MYSIELEDYFLDFEDYHHYICYEHMCELLNFSRKNNNTGVVKLFDMYDQTDMEFVEKFKKLHIHDVMTFDNVKSSLKLPIDGILQLLPMIRIIKGSLYKYVLFKTEEHLDLGVQKIRKITDIMPNEIDVFLICSKI